MGRFLGEWRDKDPYNSLHERNEYNTDDFDYNCAGFALRTYSWYCPNHESLRLMFEDYINETGYTTYEILDRVTYILVQTMLEDFKGRLRVVMDESEVFPDEELIAFRVAANYDDEMEYDPDYADFDFHYQVLRHGRWQEKNGDGPVHFCPSPLDSEAWDAGWIIYNGPQILLAKIVEDEV